MGPGRWFIRSGGGRSGWPTWKDLPREPDSVLDGAVGSGGAWVGRCVSDGSPCRAGPLDDHRGLLGRDAHADRAAPAFGLGLPAMDHIGRGPLWRADVAHVRARDSIRLMEHRELSLQAEVTNV